MGRQQERIALLALLTTACFGGVRAGAAVRKITTALEAGKPVYMAGFGNNRVATGVHDDLYTRCLALKSGGEPVVICAVDSIGLFLDDVQKIRAGVPKAKVIVAATHSHQTPDTMGLWGPREGVSGIDEAYNALVVTRTIEAANAALKSMRRARATLATTHPPELDSFIDDDRPPIVHDADLIVLRLTRNNGQGIATLINWANHPEALGSRNTLLTADFPWALCRDTESRLGGVTLFVNGALGGMQSPLGAKVRDPRYNDFAPPNSFRFAEVIGSRVADIAIDAITNSPAVKLDRIEYREETVKIPVTNEGFKAAAKIDLYRGRKAFGADGTTSTVVGLLRATRRGKPVLEAAAIPGEAYPELTAGGAEKYPEADFPDAPVEVPVKKQMTAPHRMVFGIANDEIGYIVPKAEWDEKPPYLKGSAKRWYGEINAVGPDAGPMIVDAVTRLLKQ
ncbi:MAG: hypothetical protein SFV18_04005 [Bryobacteraceae bacterium]|nr:hypothetical protein [Bryobacteraceae bacterium]